MVLPRSNAGGKIRRGHRRSGHTTPAWPFSLLSATLPLLPLPPLTQHSYTNNWPSALLKEPCRPVMDNTTIVIRGAREHNLRNVNLDLPRNCLIVFTGVSGSGKSSLAFDTLYAEGQRRYVESL